MADAAARTVTLLDASALLAAAHTRIAQVIEHGEPDASLAAGLRDVRDHLLNAQLALSDAVQPVGDGRGRIVQVRDA